MTCGIYMIKNTLNNKKYIGQSINIEERWYRHSITNDGCYIHNAIQKYGNEVFEYSILEECEPNKILLNKLEQHYIEYYKTLMPNGYNMTKGGDARLETQKKKIKQYDIDGVFIQFFESVKDAALATNIDSRYISDAANGGRNTTGGFQWCFFGEEDKIVVNPKTYSGMEKIPVCQYDLDGNFIQYIESISEAARLVNLKDTSQITKCCKEKRNYSSGGYQWRYKEDYQEKIPPYNSKIAHNTTGKKIIQLDKDGNQIGVYDSAKQAAEAVGMKKGGNAAILRVCNGEQKTSMGYIWRYK